MLDAKDGGSNLLERRLRQLKVRFLLSYGAMNGVMEYLGAAVEQTRLQAICLWFYLFGACRVQTRFRIRSPTAHLHYFYDHWGYSKDKGALVAVSTLNSAVGEFVSIVRPEDPLLDHRWWLSCQTSPRTVFQLKE